MYRLCIRYIGDTMKKPSVLQQWRCLVHYEQCHLYVGLTIQNKRDCSIPQLLYLTLLFLFTGKRAVRRVWKHIGKDHVLHYGVRVCDSRRHVGNKSGEAIELCGTEKMRYFRVPSCTAELSTSPLYRLFWSGVEIASFSIVPLPGQAQ